MILRTRAETQASSTLRVPTTSTEYSSSRFDFGPGVTMAARCTTVSIEWRASTSPSPGSRTSSTTYCTSGRRAAGAISRTSPATMHAGSPAPRERSASEATRRPPR